MSYEIKRLQEIIAVIKEYKLLHQVTPENLRKAIEALGPTFVKMGQIMSSRDDLLPKEYCLELQKLKSEAKPMEYSLVTHILSQEYHGKEYDIFDYIEEKPIGSASIAQVHKARLKNKEEVVVKVERENIASQMEMDVKLLKKASSILHVEKLLHNILDIEEALNEMYETALVEMDFQEEIRHMEDFAFYNQEIAYVKVPKVYKEWSTKRVLVLEDIDGYHIDQIDRLKELGYDMEEISMKLADNYIKQVMEDGFFHADPHADNIKIQDGKIVYLDFGMMGHVSKRDREVLKNCVKGILKGDCTEVEHALLMLGRASGSVDHMQLRNDIRRILEKNQSEEIANIDIRNFSSEIFEMLASNHITLSKDIIMLFRGLMVLESLLETIAPAISLMQVLQNHYGIDLENHYQELRGTVKQSLLHSTDIFSIPSESLHLLKGINSGEIRFNIEMSDSKNQMHKLNKMLHKIIVAILDVAFIIGTSLVVMNHEKLPFIFYVYAIGSCICTIWIFYQLIKDRKK